MQDICLTWTGWERRRLPAESAAVWTLDGPPPEREFPAAPPSGRVEVLFCRRGGLCLELPDGQRLPLEPGQVLFLPGRAGECLGRFSQDPFQGILTAWEERAIRTALAGLCPELPSAPPEGPHGCAVVAAALWNEALFHTLDQLPVAWRGSYCAIKALELLYLLHAGARSSARPPEERYYDPYQLQAVHNVHAYMLEHLDERLTIPQLAQRFHLSGTLLKACFRQVYGAPIHQYLLKRRMARAAQLLSATELTVVQVASAVGYSSAGQFGAAFRAHFQMPPAQYRRAVRKMSVPEGFCLNQGEIPSQNHYNDSIRMPLPEKGGDPT